MAQRETFSYTPSHLCSGTHHLIQLFISIDYNEQAKYLTNHNYFYRSLLDDPAFHQELQNTLNDPVPYFTQLRPASPSLPMTSTETPHANYSVCLTASRPDTVAHSHTQSKGDYKPQSCQELNPKLREQVQKSIRR